MNQRQAPTKDANTQAEEKTKTYALNYIYILYRDNNNQHRFSSNQHTTIIFFKTNCNSFPRQNEVTLQEKKRNNNTHHTNNHKLDINTNSHHYPHHQPINQSTTTTTKCHTNHPSPKEYESNSKYSAKTSPIASPPSPTDIANPSYSSHPSHCYSQ